MRLKRKFVNTYHVEFSYPTRFTWDGTNLLHTFMNIRSYDVHNAVQYARNFYPGLIVEKVTFI